MSRPLRIEFPDALYHVMSHGNGNKWIYKDSTDMNNFINSLVRIVEKYGFQIFSFTLMRNHYHILVKTPLGNLSRGMMQFNRELAVLINQRTKRKGSVFQHRYKAILVQEEEYFGNAYDYVTDNPIRAKICSDPKEYEGSHTFWVGKNDERVRKILVTSKYMGKKHNTAEDSEISVQLRNYFLGTKEWMKSMRAKAKLGNISEEIKEGWKFSLKEVDENAVKKAFTKEEGKFMENVLMFLNHKFTDITLKALGKRFGIGSISTVSQRIRSIRKIAFQDLRISGLLRMVETSC